MGSALIDLMAAVVFDIHDVLSGGRLRLFFHTKLF
jgi:hypothetical protein